MTYCTEADIENLLCINIDANSRPSTTQLALMIANADAIINAFIRQSTNITDTYGILQTVACQLVSKMINNMFYFSEPENYGMMEVALTEEDKILIQKAHSLWQVNSWEMGVD